MFNKKKDNSNFKENSYIMKDNYITDNLVVANLEYVSNMVTPHGPKVIITEQKYFFEIIEENGKVRYREIFTGFIADLDEKMFFNLPYVVNVISLKEQIPTIADNISKYALLLALNEINTKEYIKRK